MKIKCNFLFIVVFIIAATTHVVRAEELQHIADIPSTCSALTMTMRQDESGKPILYVANKDAGLRIYDISGQPRLIKTIDRKALHSLDVMNLSQSGRHLLLALGNTFSSNQKSGVAVIDVSDPARATVEDIWDDSKERGGSGAVEVEGDSVFLAAMKNGLLTFDLSRDGRLHFVSSFVPELNFPDARPDKSKINARGLSVRNGLVYLLYDAGGLRIIDVRNKNRPVEIGRYSNPVMNKKPRAYNNLVLDGDLAYVAADYCGLEVLDIGNPSRIRQVSWWNPAKCEESAWRWFKSPIHTNEIAFDRGCKTLFMSSGKSDMQVVNVSDPAHPRPLGEYGGVDNDIGTWGVSKHGRNVYLSYICTLGIPFSSRWSGVKILRYNDSCVAD